MIGYLVHGKLGRPAATNKSKVVGCTHHLNEADASVEIYEAVSMCVYKPYMMDIPLEALRRHDFVWKTEMSVSEGKYTGL